MELYLRGELMRYTGNISDRGEGFMKYSIAGWIPVLLEYSHSSRKFPVRLPFSYKANFYSYRGILSGRGIYPVTQEASM